MWLDLRASSATISGMVYRRHLGIRRVRCASRYSRDGITWYPVTRAGRTNHPAAGGFGHDHLAFPAASSLFHNFRHSDGGAFHHLYVPDIDQNGSAFLRPVTGGKARWRHDTLVDCQSLGNFCSPPSCWHLRNWRDGRVASHLGISCPRCFAVVRRHPDEVIANFASLGLRSRSE